MRLELWKRIRGYAPRLLSVLAVLLVLLPVREAQADAAEQDEATAAGAVHFSGWAFDTCKTPSAETMRAWLSSRYRAVGVYYAGRGRGCPHQPNLSRRWVGQVHRMGWQVLPVFVGSQAPCVGARHKRDVRIGRDPWRRGRIEGRQAVHRAKALGMRRTSPLYLDLEAYDTGNRRCADTTLAFVRAWNREVRRHGYLPGFYSSADSGVAHVERARRAGVGDMPSVIWFARWHTRPTLYGERALHPDGWQGHRRIHQYAGNVAETHGGRRLTVDRSRVDAPVARIR
ncbi:DUF1906 domain-containing protein [Streptomyces sp. NBC_01465]|uniref:DUF1906 domain-containing protein n=1 Tax=Streptomyces sp. NBC_01465 TaxID=2903878 RepID=UPI002E328519|nr:DUF1906 domain-containing protein [Streptomyces sp. NBC_01465]